MRPAGVLTIFAAIWSFLSPLIWEFGRAIIYEKLWHVMEPHVPVPLLFQYGPAVALLLIGLWFLWHSRTRTVPAIDFSNERRLNAFAKMDAVSLKAKYAMCRVIRAEIEVDQLPLETRLEFQRAGFIDPQVNYAVAKLNEQYRTFLEEWCSKNQSHLSKCELIRKAREFVQAVTAEHGVSTDFKAALETWPHYFELRPHFSNFYRDKIDAQRTIYVPPDGTKFPVLATWFVDEIDRLEKEWGCG